MPKRFLVTGGAGFIGSNLADELIKQGAKVSILDNLSTGFRENLEEINGDFEFVEGDLILRVGVAQKSKDCCCTAGFEFFAGTHEEPRIRREFKLTSIVPTKSD